MAGRLNLLTASASFSILSNWIFTKHFFGSAFTGCCHIEDEDMASA
jgi:hypothetical protein